VKGASQTNQIIRRACLSLSTQAAARRLCLCVAWAKDVGVDLCELNLADPIQLPGMLPLSWGSVYCSVVCALKICAGFSLEMEMGGAGSGAQA
jgi:hypothetical protein